MLEAHLAQADRHIAKGEENIARQRETLSELERDGHVDAARRARDLLAQFEDTLAMYVADRDRIRKQLEMPPQSK
jgi:hypothetical protein